MKQIPQNRKDFLCTLLCHLFLSDVWHKDQKFIAADPRDRILAAEQLRHI